MENNLDSIEQMLKPTRKRRGLLLILFFVLSIIQMGTSYQLRYESDKYNVTIVGADHTQAWKGGESAWVSSDHRCCSLRCRLGSVRVRSALHCAVLGRRWCIPHKGVKRCPSVPRRLLPGRLPRHVPSWHIPWAVFSVSSFPSRQRRRCVGIRRIRYL